MTTEDTAATNERETLKFARTHRPNYVVEAPGTKHEWTRIKCDGDGCDFYAERRGHRNWFRALDDHAEHLAQALDDREATLRAAFEKPVADLLAFVDDMCDGCTPSRGCTFCELLRMVEPLRAALAAADGGATK